MNPVVRPAGQQDIDAICSLLHNKMNQRIPVERWRKLMTYKWLRDKPDFGQLVDADGDILGYCGMVYVDRLIGATPSTLRRERMVSMSSWYLDKSLRGMGLGREMLMRCTEDPMMTYATLTNSRNPLAIVESTGFKVLEDHRYIWRKQNRACEPLTVERDIEAIRAKVLPHQIQLLDDMSNQPLSPVLLESGSDYSLMFFSVKRKDGDITWFDLMYASNLPLFEKNVQALANHLLADDDSLLAADGRFIGNNTHTAERRALPVARYYKSERVLPHELDHLYSELQLLDLKLD